MPKPFFAAATLLLLIPAAGPALAEQTFTAPSQAVTTANVDFRDRAAVRAFYDHLRATARKVCDSNSANPRIQQLDALCVNKAVAQAVRAVDRPLLTALAPYFDANGAPGAGSRKLAADQDGS